MTQIMVGKSSPDIINSKVMAPPKIYDAKVTRIVPLTDSTKHFELTFPEPIDFKPGQFVMIRVTPDGKPEVKRPYSICSVPRGTNTVEIVLNRVPGGFMSNFLCDLNEGAVIKAQLPFGQFTLREPSQGELFVATGTGIAPFRSQIGWLLDVKKHTGPVGLAFGCRYENEKLFDEEFRTLAARYSNFTYIPTVSRPTDAWTGEKGYVQDKVRKYFSKTENTDVYFCGLPAMIDDTKKVLLELGYDPKRIHEEKYV